MLLSLSLLSALVATALSLISSPSYLGLVSFSLVFAAAHFLCGAFFLRRTASRAKWLLLLVSFPMAVLTLDDLGRLLHILGAPSFRVL
jgi:hypothetical protein